MSYVYTAAVTLLTLLIYLGITWMVGKARARYGVTAPATTGNPDFERTYRVQMNTLEQMAFFLPAMWLYALFLSDKGAAVGGLIWVAARILYAAGYVREAKARGPGAMISAVAQVGLWLGAAYGVARAMLG